MDPLNWIAIIFAPVIIYFFYRFFGRGFKVIYKRKAIPLDVREAVKRRYNYRCAKCGLGRCLEIHHIVPVAKGGGNNINNLTLLCSDCHKLTR